MTTVLVSGCFDVLHAGHLAFLEDARALGDRLVVCVAGDEVLAQHKGRLVALPAEHKAGVLRGLRCVDEVRVTAPGELGLDFAEEIETVEPDVLAVTDDDRYGESKRLLCERLGVRYTVLPKRAPDGCQPVSTTAIRRRLALPAEVPVRVDFAGGWLDVPRFAREGAYVVNCTVLPGLMPGRSPYRFGGGVGGSAAAAMLDGQDALASELGTAGWQDPAVIRETGLCAWRSGPMPVLEFKRDPRQLAGRMALVWTGSPHRTADLVDRPRDYAAIAMASIEALHAVQCGSIIALAGAIERTYVEQLREGMAPLECGQPHSWLARKYCGAGHGGYALYLFYTIHDRATWLDGETAAGHEAMAIEPMMRGVEEV